MTDTVTVTEPETYDADNRDSRREQAFVATQRKAYRSRTEDVARAVEAADIINDVVRQYRGLSMGIEKDEDYRLFDVVCIYDRCY
jgi:hypothetical protein